MKKLIVLSLMLLTHDQAGEFHTGSKGEKDVEKAPLFMKKWRLLVMKKANIGWGCGNEF